MPTVGKKSWKFIHRKVIHPWREIPARTPAHCLNFPSSLLMDIVSGGSVIIISVSYY